MPTLTPHPPSTIFVYGTLKQGGTNAHVWPSSPLSILPACLPAQLFHLGPYPAAIPSPDAWLLGELWSFPSHLIPHVLAALDELEGYQQSQTPDLYHREIQPAQPLQGPPISAWIYFYANPENLAPFRIIQPSIPFRDHLCAVWNER